MPRYRYHNDWRVMAQWACGLKEFRETLEEAIAFAEPWRDKNPRISVHADCEHDGFATAAHVGFSLHEVDGKTTDEIMEMLDAKVDDYIACRVRIGKWGIEFV